MADGAFDDLDMAAARAKPGDVGVNSTPGPAIAREAGLEPLAAWLWAAGHGDADPSGDTDSWQAFKDWSTAISNAGGGIGLVLCHAAVAEDFELLMIVRG
jgi:hypothetical protein